MATPNYYQIDPTYDKLFCKCDGTGASFVDDATQVIANKKAITANGNATQLSLPTGVTSRMAGFFNGTTDYVKIDNASIGTSFNFGTGDYNISVNVFFTTVQTCRIFDLGAAYDLTLRYSGGNLFLYEMGGSISPSWTPTANTWYRITAQRVSGVTSLLINEVSIGSGTLGKTITTSGWMNIGAANSPSEYFAGWMKELRFSNIARANVVPTTEYTTDGNTVLLMHFDTPATSPLASSILFNGSSDYLSLGDSDDWDFPADFSAEAYVRFSSISGTQVILETGRYASNKGFALYFEGSTPKLQVVYNASVIGNFSWTPTVNVWYKINYTRTSGNGVMKVNDNQVGSTLVDSTSIDSSTYGVLIGKNSSGNYFNGMIREIKITKTGATVLYIKGNENNGATSFTDTVGKTVTNGSGTTVIKYTEDYHSCIFKDETGKFPYPVGSAKVDFFAIGSGVGYFPGTSSDYISVSNNADFDFAGEDFDVEAYIRLPSLASADRTIASKYHSSVGWIFFVTPNTGVMSLYSSGSVHVSVTGSFLLNTWTHVACVRYGSVIKFFINGTQVGTDQTPASTYNGATYDLQVGLYDTSVFLGLMDNIRISKGVARYTAAFNPPEMMRGSLSQIVWFG